MMYSDDELLLLSGIQHFAFCRRQWALIHVEQQWQENIKTFSGRQMHERVDDPFFTEARGTVLITRSLPLVSHQLGFYGVADVVEFNSSEDGITIKGRKGLWKPYPIEYKYGQPKADDRDMVQLCAQGICLEEMFNLSISKGALFYGRTRRRQEVEFDETLRKRVAQLAEDMHEMFQKGITPCGEYTPACKSCSLLEICLPRLGSKRSVQRYLDDALKD
jgi:CRISPR-associated exonuclease Cas4